MAYTASISRNPQVGYEIRYGGGRLYNHNSYGFAFTLRGARRRSYRVIRRLERRHIRSNSVDVKIEGTRK